MLLLTSQFIRKGRGNDLIVLFQQFIDHPDETGMVMFPEELKEIAVKEFLRPSGELENRKLANFIQSTHGVVQIMFKIEIVSGGEAIILTNIKKKNEICPSPQNKRV